MIARLRSGTQHLRRSLAVGLDAARAWIAAGGGRASSRDRESNADRDGATDQVEWVDDVGPATGAEQDTQGRVDFDWLPPAATPSPGVRPEDIGSQSEIVEHVGLTPTEFVLALVEHHDGRLEQQTFTAYTALSESSLSRLLGDLEMEGLVRRFQIGSRKVVCLPENTPRRDRGHDVEDATGEPSRTPTA